MSFDFLKTGLTIPHGWQLKYVREIADVNALTIKKNNQPNEIYYIDISSVSSGLFEKPRHMLYSEAPSRAKRILRSNDFIISTVRPNLKQYAMLESIGNNWVASTGFCVVSTKDPLASWYLYSVITSELFNEHLVRIADGAAYPAFNPREIEDALIPWPDKSSLYGINQFAKILDKKIELNRQTNQTLEQIAQAIFKSWFIDFDPVKAKIAAKQALETEQGLAKNSKKEGGWVSTNPSATDEEHPEVTRAAMCAISGKTPEELDQLDAETQQQLKTTAALFPDALVDSELGEIPEGWGITSLGNIIEFNPRRILKKGTLAPYLEMKNIPTNGHLAEDVYLREMASGTKFINGDTLLARITPCLENGKTAFVDFLEKDQIGWGSTEYIVMRPRNNRPLSLGYIIARLDSFRSKAIQTMTGTSGRQRANAKAIAELDWVDYPQELLIAFDKISGSYLSNAKINGDQNKVLAQLRDTLLPKLLSGELTLDKVNP